MLEVNQTITGHSRIDFDKVKIRRAMRKIGAEVRKEARRLVARRAISVPGQYPGRGTGALMRSIKARVSKPGFLVRIAPDKTSDMGKDFYPAFLWFGVTGNARRKDHRAQPKNGAWRIAPRENYMIDALESRRESVRSTLRDALMDSLKPR